MESLTISSDDVLSNENQLIGEFDLFTPVVGCDVEDSASLARSALVGNHISFRRNPLVFLDERWKAYGDAFQLPDGTTCFVDPTVVKEIFSNERGDLVDHSDFFHLRRGIFGPRSAQVDISRTARRFLRNAVPGLVAAAPTLTRGRLTGPTSWPDEGNLLLHALTGPLLLDADDDVRGTLADIVTKSVLAGARQRRSPLDRIRFRRQVMRTLSAEVACRRGVSGRPPRDVLDVVIAGAGQDAPAAHVVEVFLSFVFALVGSIGFALGWSVLLLGTNPPTDAPSSWVIRESLRLYPVAWFFGRTPAREHERAGVRVGPRRDIVVCTYLVHRHPAYWAKPEEFRPERWADVSGQQAYVPFGWGPHSCTGATIATDLLEALLDAIRAMPTTVCPQGTEPTTGAALAPPPFILRPGSPGPVKHEGGER